MKFTTRIAYAIFPSYAWGVIFQEARFTWQRWFGPRPKASLLKAGDLQLHLGCGPRIVAGWTNVDAAPRPQLDLQWDLRRPLPFADKSARVIYSEHFLEHLFKEDALRFLAECYRVLKPGGRIRLGVPDAEIYLRAYTDGRRDFFTSLAHLGGAVDPLATPIDVINHMFRMGGDHLFAWDFESLSMALSEIGYREISRWESCQASTPDICLDDPAHVFETLYVEAVKPNV